MTHFRNQNQNAGRVTRSLLKVAAAFAVTAALAAPAAAEASCPTSDQATTGWLHYPGLATCGAATNAAETVSQSYHYQKACSDTFGTPLGSYPFDDWSSVENVDCQLTSAAGPGWQYSPGTIVQVTVCCVDGPTLDDLLNDMIDSLLGPCNVPGANGMINKLFDIMDDAVYATDLYNAGSLSLADYTTALNDALTTLAAFDNQLAAKIANGQMGQPCGDDLQAQSASVQQMILDMLANL
jgi:hypothetical protein